MAFLASYVSLIGMIAGASKIALILSPSVVCYNIIRTGKIGKVDVDYLTVGLSLSVLGYEYGSVLNDTTLISTSIICTVLHVLYISVFIAYAENKVAFVKKKSIFPLIFSLGILYERVARDRKTAIESLYTYSSYFFLSLFVLHTIQIVRKRDAGILPLPVTIARLFSSFVWYLYGVAIDQPSLQKQNLIPLGISLIQLALAAAFPSRETTDKKNK